jgi:hypothetical protein
VYNFLLLYLRYATNNVVIDGICVTGRSQCQKVRNGVRFRCALSELCRSVLISDA